MMYRNPKNIKQEIKLFFFYLVDLGIVAGSVMASVYFAKLMPISPMMKFALYLLAFVVVFGCALERLITLKSEIFYRCIISLKWIETDTTK